MEVDPRVNFKSAEEELKSLGWKVVNKIEMIRINLTPRKNLTPTRKKLTPRINLTPD